MSTSTKEIHWPSGTHLSSQLSRLCRACQSVLTRDDLEDTEAYPHHSSLEDFIKAKSMDCYVCTYTFNALGSIPEDIQEALRLVAEGRTLHNMIEDETHPGDDTSNLRADLVRHLSGYGDTPSVSFTLLMLRIHQGSYLKLETKLNPCYEGYFPLNTTVSDRFLSEKWKEMCDALLQLYEFRMMIVPDKVFTKVFATTLPSNTGSMETWSTVNSWIQACSHHHNCMAQVNTKWHPTRLVERISNETFRIIRSDSIPQPGERYITLSHRWGSLDFIKLTANNLSKLESPSPVSLLPKTFRECLVVAQRMNIRYIWIDSLCIVQSGDNGADWQREATEMANIYTNSFCNISADYGNNHTDGLFFERQPPFPPACMVHMKCHVTDSFEDGFSTYESSPELLELRSGCLCHIMSPHGWFEDVSKSPLNRRAWVIQERLLAPRVLHFLAGQVSWECGQILAWEKAPGAGYGVDPDGSRIPSHRVLSEMEFNSVSHEMERFSFDPPERPYDFWYKLVQQYSECGLTKQSDKLVAISGVARRMALITRDQYVAGLWASQMTRALGWSRYRPGDPEQGSSRQHLKEYYTPSFSWAAADGPTDCSRCESIPHDTGLVTAFIKHRKKPLYSAITKIGRPEYNNEVITDHVFGPMTTPEVELQVRGILRTCHRLPEHLVGEDPYFWDDLFAPSKDNDSVIHQYLKKGIHMTVDYDRNDDYEDAKGNDLTYYFTIISWDVDYTDLKDKSYANGLNGARGLLLKSVDPSMGRFKRIGYIARMTCRDTDDDPVVSDIVAQFGNERNLPAWSYDEVTDEHTFYIV